MKKEIITFSNSTFGIPKIDEPTCGNGEVRVIKYRYTIEEVSEPIEVIHQRLEDLWCLSNNYHHYQPLKEEAKRLGYTFIGEFGCKKKRK